MFLRGTPLFRYTSLAVDHTAGSSLYFMATSATFEAVDMCHQAAVGVVQGRQYNQCLLVSFDMKFVFDKVFQMCIESQYMHGNYFFLLCMASEASRNVSGVWAPLIRHTLLIAAMHHTAS